MTKDDFIDRIMELHLLCDNIVNAKRPEYTEGNNDVLHNFKSVAQELKLTPEQVWYVYFRKHVASISQYCANSANLKQSLAEPIDMRIADAINYLELLYALIKESDGKPKCF